MEESAGKKIIGFVCAGIGFLIGQYAGLHFLIPAAACALIWLGAKRIFTDQRKINFIPTFSIQSAHVVWLSIAILTPNGFSSVFLDLVFISIGLTWLMFRPGLLPVIFLSIIQLLSIGVNLYSLLQATFDSTQHKALLIHSILRIAAVATLILGYFKSKKVVEASSIEKS